MRHMDVASLRTSGLGRRKKLLRSYWKAGTGVSKKSDRRDWIRFSRQCNEMDEILTSESELRVDVLANYSHLRAGELARGPSDYLNVRCRVCAAPRRSGPARDVRIKETSIMGDP